MDRNMKPKSPHKLSNIIQFNPTERLAKGTLAKKVPMEYLQPFTRAISDYETAKYSGGSKFRNGDTLMARITPCLENGKTAYVSILDDGEVGFGSTEYIVFRNIEGVTDSKFVYYFVTSPWFREIAIKSMVGSSGRQRVQQSVLENLEVTLPPLDEQRRIAGILGSLDDKIELNRRINANLEAQAQALFRSWFVDFEPFRDGPFIDSELGKIPQGWKVGTFQDIINITSGKRPPLKVDKCTSEAYIPIYGASSIQAYTTSFLRNEDLLLIGRVGTLGIVQKVTGLSWPSDNTLIITSPFYEYSYQILKTIDFNKLNRGSTQPLITQTDIKNQIILLPPNEVLYRYEKISANMFSLNKKNNSEIKTLSALRDTLLPKLMAGEIKI